MCVWLQSGKQFWHQKGPCKDEISFYMSKWRTKEEGEKSNLQSRQNNNKITSPLIFASDNFVCNKTKGFINKVNTHKLPGKPFWTKNQMHCVTSFKEPPLSTFSPQRPLELYNNSTKQSSCAILHVLWYPFTWHTQEGAEAACSFYIHVQFAAVHTFNTLLYATHFLHANKQIWAFSNSVFLFASCSIFTSFWENYLVLNSFLDSTLALASCLVNQEIQLQVNLKAINTVFNNHS